MIRRLALALASTLVICAGCATGGVLGFDDEPLADGGTVPQNEAGAGGSDGARPDASSGDSSVASTDASSDAPADAPAETSTGTVMCGGYAYPASVTTSVTCSGSVAGCTGSHEFVVVGCYTAAPATNPCPSGYKVAAMMLIGQWAAAGNVTRGEGGEVCIFAGGTATATSACGFDQANYAYCWPKGQGCCSCAGTCCSSVCSSGLQCAANAASYQAPVLCVK